MRLAGAKTNLHTFDVIAARATARLHKQPIDIPSITANTDPWVETNARTMVYFLPDLSDESITYSLIDRSRVDFYDTICETIAQQMPIDLLFEIGGHNEIAKNRKKTVKILLSFCFVNFLWKSNVYYGC